MLNRNFCGNKVCADCDVCSKCILDLSMPCSPDCENLTVDGRIAVKRCIEAGCENIEIVFDMENTEEILKTYGEIAEYPYDVLDIIESENEKNAV